MPLTLEDKKKYPFVKEYHNTCLGAFRFQIYMNERGYLIKKLKKKNRFECCICFQTKVFHMRLCDNNHNDYVCLNCAEKLDKCPICIHSHG